MITLAHQLQTLGRAESKDIYALKDALKRLNAQNASIWPGRRGFYVATCTPQPQDCGPLPEERS